MEARNEWQPVTDVYQQVTGTASPELDDDPVALVNAVRNARSRAEGKAPFGVTAITGLYFARAAIYGLFAAKLVSSSDSDLAAWITLHCPALIPITLGTNSKTLPTTMGEALAVMAILSLGMGVLWLLRWKPILFISVALAGYYFAYIVVSYFNVAGLGNPNLFASEQIDILVLESALNLVIFLFVVLYPKLKDNFRRDF